MTPDGSRREPGPGGRRRDVIGQVGAELAGLRRDVAETCALVREHGGLLAEALPRLDVLEMDLAQLRGVVAVLADTAENDTAAEEADQAARAAVGMAPAPPGPWAWPLLDQETATAAWDALDHWVGEVLCAWYAPARGELPDCWPLHRRAVLELTWLRQSHVDAYAAGAPSHLAAEWHARWLPAALAGVASAIDPARCPPGQHLTDPRDRERRSSDRERERARAEMATPAHWHPHLRAAADADATGRRHSE